MEAARETPTTLVRGDRKERTRAAMVAAAQRFLAAGTVSVSIQDLTDAAGVGFGSFYNHFGSKEELFEAAVMATVDTWTLLRDAFVEGIEDPAEVFAVSFRMTGRLQRAAPELVRVLLHAGAGVLIAEQSLRSRVLADIRSGVDARRFSAGDPDLLFMAVGGAMLGLLQHLEAHPELDGDAISDAFTHRVLLMLGVGETEASRLISLPLPAMPEIT